MEIKKPIDRWIYSEKLVHIRAVEDNYLSLNDKQIADSLFIYLQKKLIPFNIFMDKDIKNTKCIVALEDGFINFKHPSEFKMHIKSGELLIFLFEIDHVINFKNKEFTFTREIKEDYVY